MCIRDRYGFIETPYRKVDKATGRVSDNVEYLTADEEEMLIIAQANEPLDSEGHFVNQKVASRGACGEIDLGQRENCLLYTSFRQAYRWLVTE